MNRILVVMVFAALMLPIGSASAANPQGKQIKALQKQVTALQKQVKTLQTQVQAVKVVAGANLAATTCGLAMVADVFQATWKVLDDNGLGGGAIGATVFHPLLTPLNDYGACTDLKLTRQMGLSVPSWTAYSSLTAFFFGP